MALSVPESIRVFRLPKSPKNLTETRAPFPKKSDCTESLLKKVPMGAVSTRVSIAETARKPMSARPAFAVEDPAVTARTAINTVLISSRKCVQNSPSRPMSAPTAKIGRGVLCESKSISRILQTSPIGRRSPKAGRGWQSTRWNWSASIKSSHRLSRMDNLSTMSL